MSERLAFHLNSVDAKPNGRFGISYSGAVKADLAIADEVEGLRAGAKAKFG